MSTALFITAQAEEFVIPDGNVTALIDAIIAANATDGADTIILGARVIVSLPPDPPIAAGIPQPAQPSPGFVGGSVYTLSKSADARIPFKSSDGGLSGLPVIDFGEIEIVGHGAIIQRDSSLGCSLNNDVDEAEFRIIEVSERGNLTIENATIQNGCADGTSLSSMGGGIASRGKLILKEVNVLNNISGSHGGGIGIIFGNLEISHSTIADTISGFWGGGVSFIGFLNRVTQASIRNSTISGNSAENNGGGMYVISGVIQLNSATISNNMADRQGIVSGSSGGVSVEIDAQAILRNSILAANFSTNSLSDCSGSIMLVGSNLIGNVGTAPVCEIIEQRLTDIIGEDPMLLPLGENGGRTATHALSPDSPAINKGECPPDSTDQRGEPRVVGPACDIGAYESDVVEQVPENQAPTVTLSVEPQNPTTNDVIQFTADASDPDGDDLTYEWSINDIAQPQLQGSTAQWTDPVPGTHTMKVVVSDGNGGVTEDSVTFTVTGDSPEQPMTLAQALDTNGNGRLDDAEILKAIQFWIAGTIVPGADTTISDSDILNLIQLWISGGSV
jgi:hypothetical protein